MQVEFDVSDSVSCFTLIVYKNSRITIMEYYRKFSIKPTNTSDICENNAMIDIFIVILQVVFFDQYLFR